MTLPRHDPILLIRLGELNLSERSEPRHLSLKHTEKGEGGKEAEIYVADPDLTLIDDPNVQEGVSVTWRFGYPELLSPLYRGTIYEVQPIFDVGGGNTLIVRAYDGIAEMMARERTRVWQGTSDGEAKITESDIAETIAAEYGYNIDSEETALYYSEIAQSGYDYDFIRNELAVSAVAKDPAKPGPYRAWFGPDGTLNFRPVPLFNSPKKSFRYQVENDDPSLLQFTVKSQGYRPDETGGAATTASDASPGSEEDGSSTQDNASQGTVAMGRRNLDLVAGVTWKDADPDEATGERITDPDSADPIHTDDHAAARAGAAQARDELEALEATATVLGDPEIVANDILEFLNLGRKYSGPYLVDEVYHLVGPNGFTTELSLKKNALNTAPEDGEGRSTEASGSEVGSNPEGTERREIDLVSGFVKESGGEE